MKQLNTYPIEEFLDKARIAIKSNQQTVILTIKEATDLQNSLAVVMTRLAGQLDQISSASSNIEVKMDGGKF
jgi:hypothetical protein